MKDYKGELMKLDPKKETNKRKKHFSEKKFVVKMVNYAKKMGMKLSYYSLLLFYTFKSPHTPQKAKFTIAGALGYLILPIDAIPDFIPIVGFSDDFVVIMYAIYQVISHIDNDIKIQASKRMKHLFGENYDDKGINKDLKPE